MANLRTIKEINEKIANGTAVILTAGEMTKLVQEEGKESAAKKVDVVTTGTFSTMCSSGVFFNIGQQPPLMKVTKMWLNNVFCYSGIAAVDAYIGCTEVSEDDPLNKVYPGAFKYGGGHVVEDLIKGKTVHLRAEAYGTDCYPRKEIEKDITLDDLRDAVMLNPRNCYQNYNCAINYSNKTIYTYMGPIKPNGLNANYATAGEYSPLFNDPYFKTIGLGTKILMGGAEGFVIGAGTQHDEKPARNERGIPLGGSGTLMLKGDLKKMNPRYVRGLSIIGYGCSIALGVAIPIPILNEDLAWYTGVANKDIQVPVKDYGNDYPNGNPRVIKHVTFEELQSGEIEVEGKKVQAVPLTSYALSIEVAEDLKERILKKEFFLTEAQDKIVSE